MKKVMREYYLYTIEELKEINEKTYNEVLSKAREDLINFRFNNAEDDVLDLLKEKYNLGDEIDNIYYSISYCQGDGFCFTTSNLLSYSHLTKKDNLNVFEEWIINNLDKELFDDLLEYLNDGYNIKIIKNTHHYEHKYTCNMDYELFYSSDDDAVLQRINDNMLKICKLLFHNVYCDICDYIEKYLYSYYEISEDEIIEELNINGYLFTINGEMECE